MKKILLAALTVITITSCEKKETVEGANLHINGNIEGLSQGKLYIQTRNTASLASLLRPFIATGK